jgi:serine protease Do
VTTGVISALDRSLRAGDHTFHGFLQTDASINPGNSGGPLLNAEGSLIGINSAIYGGGAQGIGFAIPINTAMRVVNELIEHGEVQPVWLGLEFQDLDPLLHEVMNLPPDVIGALVNRVREDSPAERAGLTRGDIVMSLDGRTLRGARDFFESLETVTDGQSLQLGVWRDSRVRQVPVTAQEVPAGLIADLADQLLGMQLEPTGTLGFVVTKVRTGSAATRIGIREGDLLLGVNGRALNGEDDLRRAVLDLRGHDRALVVVQRGSGRYHLTIPLV